MQSHSKPKQNKTTLIIQTKTIFCQSLTHFCLNCPLVMLNNMIGQHDKDLNQSQNSHKKQNKT